MAHFSVEEREIKGEKKSSIDDKSTTISLRYPRRKSHERNQMR